MDQDNKTSDDNPTNDFNEDSQSSSPEPVTNSDSLAAEETAVDSSMTPGNDDLTKSTPKPIVATAPIGSKPKKSFSLKKILLIAVIVVALLGGGAVLAYVGYYLPNKPENVVATAIINTLSKEKLSFATEAEMKTPDSPVATKILVDGGYDAELNMELNTQVEISAFKLSANTIILPSEKTLYIRINELPSLLALVMGGQPSPLDSLATKLNENWVQVSVDELKELGVITEEQASVANSCIDAYLQTSKDVESLSADLESAYISNLFLQATEEGKETIDGKSTTKYKLGYDEQKAQSFIDAVEEKTVESTNQLNTACGVTEDAQTEADEAIAVDDYTLGDTYAWVTADKQLAKFSTSISDQSQSVNLSATFSDKEVNPVKPDNVVTLSDLQNDLMPLLSSLDLLNVLGESTFN